MLSTWMGGRSGVSILFLTACSGMGTKQRKQIPHFFRRLKHCFILDCLGNLLAAIIRVLSIGVNACVSISAMVILKFVIESAEDRNLELEGISHGKEVLPICLCY